MGIRVEITYEHWRGRTVYVLLEDVHVSVDGVDFIIPTGTQTDFMSIPAILRGLVSIVNKRAVASLLHDYLLQCGTLSARKCDYYFRQCLKGLGMGRIERYGYWAAVRLNSMSKGFIGGLFE